MNKPIRRILKHAPSLHRLAAITSGMIELGDAFYRSGDKKTYAGLGWKKTVSPQKRDPKKIVRTTGVRPYLAGTDWGDTRIGAATAAAVNMKKEAPHIEHIDDNPGIGTRITRKSLIEKDPNGKEWLMDKSDTRFPVRAAHPSDLVHPTRAYAKTKTNRLIVKHSKELEGELGKAIGDEGRERVNTDFLKRQQELSGERPKAKERERIHGVHQGEIKNIRKNIAVDAMEGRALVHARNHLTGRPLEKHEIPGFLTGARKDLDAMVEHHVSLKHEEHRSMMAGLQDKIGEEIGKRHMAEKGETLGDADLYKKTRNHMQVLEAPVQHEIDIHKHYGHLADVLGKTPVEVQGIHRKLSDLHAEGSEGARALKRQELIKTGGIFDREAVNSAYKHIVGEIKEPALRTNLKAFPLLRKAKIGAAVAGAAAVGAGISKIVRKKKEEPVAMSDRRRIIHFGSEKKKIVKKLESGLTEEASRLMRNAELKANGPGPDLPHVLGKVRSAQEAVEDKLQTGHYKGARGVPTDATGDFMRSQAVQGRKEALGQTTGGVTHAGFLQTKAHEAGLKNETSSIDKATRAIAAAKTGIRKGPGAVAQRALGGHIGRDPSLMGPTEQRVFNAHLSAINKSKDFKGHREWLKKSTGVDIGTQKKVRREVATKIKRWKTQANTASTLEKVGTGIASELEGAQKENLSLKGHLAEIRTAGQDFPHRIRIAKQEGYEQADTEAKRLLGQAKGHWEGKIKTEIGKKEAEHATATRKIKQDVRKKIAIGTGVGAAGGATAGYEAGKKKDKKEHQFSDTLLKAAVGVQNGIYRADKASGKLMRKIARKQPLVHAVMQGAGNGMKIPVPGSASAGAVMGGIRHLTTRKLTPDQVIARVHAKKPIRMSRRIKVIHFDEVQPPPKKIGKIHDILTGGIEGGAGVFATDRLIKGLEKFGPQKGPWSAGKKLAIGAGVGAAATGLIGAGVTRIEKRRVPHNEDQQLHRGESVIEFISRTAVTQDRYKKGIHEIDATKAESNYLRSGLVGGALGSLLGKGPASKRFLTGAAIGTGIQALTRVGTAGTKDDFGDRSYAGKRIDNAPAQAGALAAGGILVHRSLRKIKELQPAITKGKAVAEAAKHVAGKFFSARGRIIRFDDRYEDSLGIIKRRRSHEAIVIDKAHQHVKRGARLVRDVVAHVKGERVLDARGREKAKEWDKPWVRNAITGAIITGTGAGIGGVYHIAKSAGTGSTIGKFVEHLQTGTAAKAAKNFISHKVPGAQGLMDKISGLGHRGSEEIASAAQGSSLLGKLNKGIEEYASKERKPKVIITRGNQGEEIHHHEGTASYRRITNARKSDTDKLKDVGERKATTKIERAESTEPPISIKDWIGKKKPETELRAQLRGIIELDASTSYDDNWEDWLRKRPGATPRQRRGATWSERKENQKIIKHAQLGGALVLGTALGSTFRRKPIEEGAEKIVKKIVTSGAR